jgi:hypothetical protein
MSGIFKYYLKEGQNTIGKKLGDYEPNITISGVGIHKQQCVLEYNDADRKTMIQPNQEDKTKYRVMVNGELIET